MPGNKNNRKKDNVVQHIMKIAVVGERKLAEKLEVKETG